MFISPAAFKIACELVVIGAVGLVALLAFVVLTVDRINVRLAELEAQLADREGASVPAGGRRLGRSPEEHASRLVG